MDEINIENIRGKCKNGFLRWTNHAQIRILQRNININDVAYTLINGEIIEQYPNDYPYPSCLVLSSIKKNKYLHVVCGIGDEEIWIITAYYPNPDEWTNGFRVRKDKTQ
ncbi:MAG: DUF4258 domain-containing protein [Oscillospiraceae bacterium]|nr:DUF4258 domain-containing protein [Oscillospiraceae bacterium]